MALELERWHSIEGLPKHMYPIKVSASWEISASTTVASAQEDRFTPGLESAWLNISRCISHTHTDIPSSYNFAAEPRGPLTL